MSAVDRQVRQPSRRRPLIRRPPLHPQGLRLPPFEPPAGRQPHVSKSENIPTSTSSSLSSASEKTPEMTVSNQQSCSSPPATPSSGETLQLTPSFCNGCHKLIADKFFLQTTDGNCWHENCLTCRACGCYLDQSCFMRNAQPYCKADYDNLFSGKCSGCLERIPSTELVMRVGGGATYHLACFACSVCSAVLHTGDQFVLRGTHIYCRAHFEKHFPQLCNFPPSQEETSPEKKPEEPEVKSEPDASPNPEEKLKLDCEENEEQGQNSDNELDSPKDEENSDDENDDSAKDKNSSQQKPCRKRVILTTQQRRAFKAAFDLSSKPCRKVREQLARETGLSVRVVQVWFQNERAKVKKLAKRQQQQHQNHLEQGLSPPHHMLSDDGNYNMFISTEGGYMHPAMDGRFPAPPNLIGSDGSMFPPPPHVTNDMFMCPPPPHEGAVEFSEYHSSGLEIKDDLYSSLKMGSGLLNPIDKLYSMQSSYFTPS